MRLTRTQRVLAAALASVLLLIAAMGCSKRERPAPRVEVTTPDEPRSGDVIISYVLYDTDSYPAGIKVEYSLDGGLHYYDATEGVGGDGTTLLSTNQRGIAHSFVWDSVTDAGCVNEDNARIMITATTRKASLPSATSNFILDNFALGQWEPNVRADDDTGTAGAESPKLAAESDTV